MYDRKITRSLEQAREDTPVVLLSGPRQVGKSTLAQRAAQTPLGSRITFAEPAPRIGAKVSRYFTLDDATTFAAMSEDPQGWLQNARSQDWTVIDEVQRLPDLLIAIKRDVDLDRRPNRYLLTGSANVMTIPRVAESLAGRVELYRRRKLKRLVLRSWRKYFQTNAWSGAAQIRATILSRVRSTAAILMR
jgi:predicted AAA+ superfamily ATPase